MIYEKREFVQDGTGDREFPIKVVDRLEAVDGTTMRYIGRATLNLRTPFGVQQFPVSFEIEAGSVEDAFAGYAEAARPKIEQVRQRFMARLEEFRRQQEQQAGGASQPGAGGIISLDDHRS